MNWQTRLFTLAATLSMIGLHQAWADLVAPRADSGCTARNGDLFSPPTQSPQWAVDKDGVPIDLVQFYVHGPLLLLESLFVQQGWAEALPGNIPDDVVYGGSIVLGANWVVQRMPVSLESLCGKKMITAYELDNDPLG